MDARGRSRRFYHARDLGEPFDFLTWFELAPEHATAFEDLVGILRGTEEWTCVEREVDVRLSAISPTNYAAARSEGMTDP